MNVLYDLSLLGFCKEDPGKITGMPRVILEQGTRLQTVSGCEVTFCATEDPAETYPVVRRHPAFQTARVVPWTERSPAALPSELLARSQIFHTPHSAVPDEVRVHPGLAVVQTVYDMIPFLLPGTLTQEYQDYYGDIIRRIQPNDQVITISESAKHDFCGYTGFAPERVHVIPLAADTRLFQPCQGAARITAARVRYAIPEGRYLLSVCTFEPRKNLRHVIRSFVELVQSQPDLHDLHLVLAGGRGWLFEPILAELAQTAHVRDRIITTGYVDDANLAPLYSGAEAFLYLSRYEGFGLPPLEAMQCGTPVVTSNTSSLPEVVGDAGILLDPDDQAGLCQAMHRLCSDSKLRGELARRSLARAPLFSWEANIRQTVEVYRSAAEEKRSSPAASFTDGN